MMLGEINFDDLYYPARMTLVPKWNYTGFNATLPFPEFNNSAFTIPRLIESDVLTDPKPQFYPGTALVLTFFMVVLMPVVIINLIVGLAVNDVQVR